MNDLKKCPFCGDEIDVVVKLNSKGDTFEELVHPYVVVSGCPLRLSVFLRVQWQSRPLEDELQRKLDDKTNENLDLYYQLAYEHDRNAKEYSTFVIEHDALQAKLDDALDKLRVIGEYKPFSNTDSWKTNVYDVVSYAQKEYKRLEEK